MSAFEAILPQYFPPRAPTALPASHVFRYGEE